MTERSDAALARVRAGRNDLYRGFGVEHPELVTLPAGSGACRAETFDGRERRRCTRPASFLRDGLACCAQHSRLDNVRAAE
jgi:hypothetical protein